MRLVQQETFAGRHTWVSLAMREKAGCNVKFNGQINRYVRARANETCDV